MEKSIVFTGIVKDRKLYCDGVEIKNDTSLINHSPDGFMWGYNGSGPAQCSFMILFTYFTKVKGYAKAEALRKTHALYQDFKFGIISKQSSDEDFMLPAFWIDHWIAYREVA
jgi:hypothetical protein